MIINKRFLVNSLPPFATNPNIKDFLVKNEGIKGHQRAGGLATLFLWWRVVCLNSAIGWHGYSFSVSVLSSCTSFSFSLLLSIATVELSSFCSFSHHLMILAQGSFLFREKKNHCYITLYNQIKTQEMDVSID